MQNQLRPSDRPSQANYRVSRSRQRAQQKKRRRTILAATSFVAIIVIFAVIHANSKFASWVWLVVASSVWGGILLANFQQKTTGNIVKIEIVDTVPRGRSSIVIFRETTESGLVRIVQHEAGGFGYQTELALMNVLENSEVERRKRAR